MASTLKMLVAAAVVAATIATNATSAAAACFTPFDADLAGRTFTAIPSGGCVRASSDASRFATITGTTISYDESTPRGVRLRTIVLSYGRAGTLPTITVTNASGNSVKSGPWGAPNRARFVAGLTAMIRGLANLAAGCSDNRQLWGVVSFLRVLAYQYNLPEAARVCAA
eukprot:TRINITY_DN1195_c0_g1_i5.p3 TRINITY_DN1195_c0_g1~~TRINITY_DN1195_c0_g1_i5.p3  ORF type:complete len:169 (+),score=63.14 TRINITY_DN1195_c0_g1_i5:415-921(+)